MIKCKGYRGMDEQSKKKTAAELWKEINRAIVNSSRVRDSLDSMKEQGMLDYLCEHDFLLDGKKLIKEMLEEPRQLDEQENKLHESVRIFLEDQGQLLPSIKSTIFPKGFFSVN